MKLNIGCGNKKIDGYLGVDKSRCDAVDYICDLENEKLPFNNESFDTSLSVLNELEVTGAYTYDLTLKIPKVATATATIGVS